MQWVIDAGYMDNKLHKIERKSGLDVRPTPKVTLKGVPWITKKYLAWLNGDDGMKDQPASFILDHYRTKLRETLQNGGDYRRSFWKFVLSLRQNKVTAELPGLDTVEQAMEAGRLSLAS